MTSCWKGIGSLLSECVPSIVEPVVSRTAANTAAVAPDETHRYVDDINSSSDSYGNRISGATHGRNSSSASINTSTGMANSSICNYQSLIDAVTNTATTAGGGARYRAYRVPSTTAVSRNSFIIAQQQQHHHTCLPGDSNASSGEQLLLLPPYSGNSGDSRTRRRTNSCSRCSVRSSASQNSSESNSNVNNSSSSVGVASQNNSSDSSTAANPVNSHHHQYHVELVEARIERPQRRRASSVSAAGLIGVGGRTGATAASTTRYLIVRPMTNTRTHTLGKYVSVHKCHNLFHL